MRALLAVFLPACLIAPDRPGATPGDAAPPPPPPPGDGGTFEVAGPGNLPSKTPLSAGDVGPLPSGGDGLFRAATATAAGMQVFAFSGVDGAHYDYTFSVPAPEGAVLSALDVSVHDGKSLLTMMIEAPALSFVEVAVDATGGTLYSATSTTLTIDPPMIGEHDAPDEALRFLHRMPLTGDIWFGGGYSVGVIAETTVGQVAPPAFFAVAGAKQQAFFDAFPLPAMTGTGATAVLVGEATTCNVIKMTAELACTTLLRSDSCATGDCQPRITHRLRGDSSYAGFSAAQPDKVEVELVTNAGAGVASELPKPVGQALPVGEDLVMLRDASGPLDGVALWIEFGTTAGELLAYTNPDTGTAAAGPSLAQSSVTIDETVMFEGHFGQSTGDRVLVVGTTSDALGCYDLNTGSITACPD